VAVPIKICALDAIQNKAACSSFSHSMDILKALVARVARAFYDPKYIAILDALNNAPPNTNGYPFS
jgi:hypothetical protein